MNKNNILLTWLAIILPILVFSGATFSTVNENAAFTSPEKGDTIKNRKNFVVSLQVKNFNKSKHHWVAIATVTGHSSSWERVMALYKDGKDEHNAARDEMNRRISEWKLDQFWPKFYISESPCENNVHDGGMNPMKGIEPQPMVLLILRVDDPMHEYFKKWFREGPEKGYPGIKISRLAESMILARCEIFFP